MFSAYDGRCPDVWNKLVVEDLRRDHLVVAVARVEPSHVGLEEVVDGRAARKEERRRGRVRMEAEELELLAELAVVALLRFFELLEMRTQGLR